MNYINGALNFFSLNFLKKARHVPQVKFNPIDAYLNYFFMIVNWEDPKLSWIAFLLFNFIFMLIIYYEVKFYCILFQIILVNCLLGMFGFELKEQPNYISFAEIKNTCNGIVVYLRALKRENPSLFFSYTIIFFLGLMYIGQSISGAVLCYILIFCLFFFQQVIKLIPMQYKIKIQKILTSLQNTEGVVAEAELIPYLSNRDFNNEDQDGDLDSLITDKTQDSLSSLFLSGVKTMPSYLEADNAEGIEEEDLVPPSSQVIDYSSDSSDSEVKQIKFDPTHFNGSSDEETHFMTGLKFSDALDGNALTNITQSVGTGLYNIGANLITNVLQSARQHETQRQDSDSDFEIIPYEGEDNS